MDNRERTEKQRVKAERQRQEDIALSKVLYWFGGAVVMEVLLFLTKRYYIDFDTSEWSVNLAYGIGQALKFIPIAALILAVLGFVWCFSRKRQGKGGVLPWAVSSFLLGLAVCSFLVYRFNPSGADLLTYLRADLRAAGLAGNFPGGGGRPGPGPPEQRRGSLH